MVQRDIAGRGVRDARILAAFRTIPRELFVPREVRSMSYVDAPLPIGDGQTISQPYIVAMMTDALSIRSGDRVLEIGTGSGYQAAVLAELEAEVWTLERLPRLSQTAAVRLRELGYRSIRCCVGDGTLGLPDEAPFDRIVASGSLPAEPAWLSEQLVDDGVFVGPIGSWYGQQLTRIVYHDGRLNRDRLGACRFVPLVGAGGWEADSHGKR